MQGKLVSVEDFISIQNLFGAYQWLVDEGNQEGYADLFTEDAAVLGMPEVLGPPDTFTGREGLKKIPALMGYFGGKVRHLIGSFTVRYGDTSDEAQVRYYALVVNWQDAGGPKLDQFALVNSFVIRTSGEWKIKTHSMKLL